MHQKESRANIGEVLCHNHESLRAQVARDGAVERRGVKLAKRIVRGVRKINDDEIEAIGVRIHPWKRIGVDDVHARGKAEICH